MKKNYHVLFILILITFTLISCEKPEISTDQKLLRTLYADSQDTILIGTGKYYLEPYLSRDFFPGGPIPTKRKLVALFFLVNADSLPISANITISKLYVIKDQEVWISVPKDSNQPAVPDFKLDKVSIDGPEWNTDIYVDVVVEVVNDLSKSKFLLIATHQYIERIE